MYLLYLDESGSTDASHFVLAGLMVSWRDVEPLANRIDQLMSTLPVNARSLELHAGQVRTGRRQWSRIPRSIRWSLIHNTTRLISQQTQAGTDASALIATVIDREYAPLHDIYNQAYRTVFEICERWLHNQDQTSRWIAISDKTRLEPAIQSLAVPTPNDTIVERSGPRPYPRLLEPPMFLDSRMSRALQLADFAAHWLYRYFEHGDDSIAEALFPVLHQRDGVVEGLIHLTDHAQSCPCVACRSRR